MADTAQSTTGRNGGLPAPPNKTAEDPGGTNSSATSTSSMANKQGVKKLLER